MRSARLPNLLVWMLLVLVPGSLAPGAAVAAPANQPANPPGATAEPTPTEEPKPPPDTEAPDAPILGEPVVEAKGEVLLPAAAEDNSFVVVTEVAVDGEPVEEQVVAQGRGNGASEDYTWTADSGERDYEVVATDKAGNESEPATVTITIDADPPVIRRFEVTPGTAREPLSTVELVTQPDTTYALNVDGEEVAAGTTAARGRELIEETLDLADGRYPVEVELSDETGNTTEDSRVLVVAVGDLFVRARLTTGPTDPQQVVDIRATPGTTGTLEVLGGPEETFEVAEDGTAQVRLDLDDGEYDGAVVTVEDANARRGSAELTDFAVDTTLPGLELAAVDGIAEEGRLRFEVTAEEGFEVDWRVLDTGGRVVTLGTFIASEVPEVIERDLDEGSYTVQVATSDIFDRTAEQEIAVDVAADPLSPRTLALGALVLLVVLLALALVARRLWRRRQERRKARRALGPAVTSQDDRGAYQRSEETWVAQHQDLTRLAAVARGTVPDDLEVPDGFALEPGETALWSAGARLLVASGLENADTLLVGERGSAVVTDRRLAFVGSTPRDWWLADVDRLRHLDHERTVIRLRDADDWAGVSYDAQVTRQYIDLALARVQGASYAGIVDRGLRDHELRRPTPPV